MFFIMSYNIKGGDALIFCEKDTVNNRINMLAISGIYKDTASYISFEEFDKYIESGDFEIVGNMEAMDIYLEMPESERIEGVFNIA